MKEVIEVKYFGLSKGEQARRSKQIMQARAEQQRHEREAEEKLSRLPTEGLASQAYKLEARWAEQYAESKRLESVTFEFKAKLYARLANGESIDPELISEYHRHWNAPHSQRILQSQSIIGAQLKRIDKVLKKRGVKLAEIDICIPPPDSPLEPLSDA